MRRDDPLDELEWRFLDRLMAEHEISPERIAELRAATRAALDRVADLLDNPPQRRSWYDIPQWGLGGGLGLAAEDVPRAQVLCRRVADAGGTGSRDIQEELFSLISQAQEPVSVPFWVELLDYTRPRDQVRGAPANPRAGRPGSAGDQARRSGRARRVARGDASSTCRGSRTGGALPGPRRAACRG